MKNLFITLIAVFTGMVAAFAQTSYEVKFNDLPKDTKKYISKNYEGYHVDNATQGQNKKGDVMYTDVIVSKGTEKHKLVFDKDGEFVKAEAVAAAPAPPAAPPAPPAKHDSAAAKPHQEPAPAPAHPDTTKK